MICLIRGFIRIHDSFTMDSLLFSKKVKNLKKACANLMFQTPESFNLTVFRDRFKLRALNDVVDLFNFFDMVNR